MVVIVLFIKSSLTEKNSVEEISPNLIEEGRPKNYMMMF